MRDARAAAAALAAPTSPGTLLTSTHWLNLLHVLPSCADQQGWMYLSQEEEKRRQVARSKVESLLPQWVFHSIS